MADVIPFPRPYRGPKPVPVVYSDARIEFARRVENRLEEMEQQMAGDRPCDSGDGE